MPPFGFQKGARRCGICSINYPPVLRFKDCPVCGCETSHFTNVEVDENWLELAEHMVWVIDGEVPDYPPEA